MMDRRSFLRLFAGITVLGVCRFVLSCGGESPLEPEEETEEPDFVLSGKEGDVEVVGRAYDEILGLAQNPGQTRRIGYQDTDGYTQVLLLSVGPGGQVRLQKEGTGEEAYLHFGWKGLSPSIRFTEDQAGEQALFYSGQDMEFPFFWSGAPSQVQAPRDWFILGLKALGLGLAIWLGAKIVGLVIAAIGWLAFNAMVVGILIAAAAVFSKILDRTGWDLGQARDFFQRTAAEITQLFQDLAAEIS